MATCILKPVLIHVLSLYQGSRATALKCCLCWQATSLTFSWTQAMTTEQPWRCRPATSSHLSPLTRCAPYHIHSCCSSLHHTDICGVRCVPCMLCILCVVQCASCMFLVVGPSNGVGVGGGGIRRVLGAQKTEPHIPLHGVRPGRGSSPQQVQSRRTQNGPRQLHCLMSCPARRQTEEAPHPSATRLKSREEKEVQRK